MTFEEAEVKFHELQARRQRGEPISRAKFEEQVSELMVQDERGVWWEIHPRTGKWMYFDATDWVEAIPPGREQLTVTSSSNPSSPFAPSLRPPQPSRSSFSSPVTPSASISPRHQGVSASRTPDMLVAPIQRMRMGVLQIPRRDSHNGWIPLAIGMFVLFSCVLSLFFGGRFVWDTLNAQAGSTRKSLVSLPTYTPLPTIVRLPTTIATLTPSPVIATVIEQRVNLRAAPSTQAKIIGKLDNGNQITLIGRNKNGDWYQVMLAGATEPGWVFGETLQIANGDPNGLPIVESS